MAGGSAPTGGSAADGGSAASGSGSITFVNILKDTININPQAASDLGTHTLVLESFDNNSMVKTTLDTITMTIEVRAGLTKPVLPDVLKELKVEDSWSELFKV